jgi:predicted dehydrogenase
MTLNSPLDRKLRMGMVGGGQGAFIGRVHVLAATLDQRAEFVAAALSSDPQRARRSAEDYGLARERSYASYTDMLREESNRSPDERIDFVSIATPNDTHFQIAGAFVQAGFNVICDKPMTSDLTQAEALGEIVRQAGIVFVLTHNYTGYPLVRQARDMIAAGELGEIQGVRVDYIQGWLRERLETQGHKQAAWRTDPRRAGPAGCFGDIGSHAYNLFRFMTRLLPGEVSCSLKIFEPGRQLDDYGVALIRCHHGCLATITASQISHGRDNDLSIEIDGTKASLLWRQEKPNQLAFLVNGQPRRVYTRDPYANFTTALARASCRLPAGHPEGFLEAFANVYTSGFEDMIAHASGKPIEFQRLLYPSVNDGIDGVNFISQCVASSAQSGRWISLDHPCLRS